MFNVINTHRMLKREVFTENHGPIIITVKKFDETSVTEFNKEFDKAIQSGQPIIPINIDSYGGQAYSLMAMLATVRSSPVPVATFIEGKGMSCGSFLAAFGTVGYRYASEYSTMMVHEVGSMSWGKIQELKVSVEESIRLNDGLFSRLARHCGHPADYFLNRIHEKNHADWFLDAGQMKDERLIDHIGVPKLVTTVDVSIKLELTEQKH
jgi:ATP-dependent Clp protease protease subunit